MDYHPELEKITEKSIYKCGQVVIKMLIDLGMVTKKKLQKIDVDTNLKNVTKWVIIGLWMW
jgi:uncharacterized protein YutE (UPF0331/DUF86 family)